ncbi:MAG: endonuclease [Actinomycetia bacterium]|nr:endonuclease [Actinomycetes bacterium]
MSGSLDRYRTMATEDVAAAYRDLGGLARAIDAQRLQLLAVLDERQAWRLDGALDAAQWVAATDVVGAAAARDAVDTARALTELPAIAAVAEAGGLSMAQLVPLAVIAEPSTDARWAVEGPGRTPGALVQLARQRRKVAREQAERQRGRRFLRRWKDRQGLGTRIAGLLPDADAEIVWNEIHRRAEEAPPDDEGVYEPYESRCADALVEACSSSCEAAGHPEVVVHVPVGVEQLAPTLDDGTPVATDVLRRLACDATARLLVENPDGTVAGYGRRKRIVPDKLRNRLRQRDRHCRFPGCHRRRGLKAHHLEHWTEGGETDEDQLLLPLPPPPRPGARGRLDRHR